MADVVNVAPRLSLAEVPAQIGNYLDGHAAEFHDKTPRNKRQPKPDPDTLYSGRLRALMPDPAEQVRSCLAVQLTGAQKQALDILATWPRCTTGQLTGLMGGVSCRSARQVIRSLSGLSMVRDERGRHVLTDGAAAAGAGHGSTPEPPCAPSGWPTGVIGVPASWSSNAGPSPPSGSGNGCATTAGTSPRSGPGGTQPLVLFVFETPEIEEDFADAAGCHGLPVCTSDLELFEERCVLGEVWRPPPPAPYERLTIHGLDNLQSWQSIRARDIR